jgi:poly-gamma-glutamate synthesis protein (capsule biosynthesis protein)
MDEGAIRLVLAGDLVLDEPDAGYWLAGIAPALREADLAIGHLEVPHTHSLHELGGDVPAPGAPPENLAALADAGFGMVSLAGNHMADCGAQGIADTITGLERHGIAHCGAGADLGAARRPALAGVHGQRVALLSYNCVGPEATWAAESRAGCAYLPMRTADGAPVSPRADIVAPLPAAFDILAEDIALARVQADHVLVALHKGIVHTPATLAPYECAIARAAIEHGADAVLSHHAHIARGIEFHRGRPIFHGLGNGCVVTRALAPEQDHPARREWARKRREMFGFEPDPAYTLAPFHPEGVNAFLGQLTLHPGHPPQAAIVPLYVEPPGRPVLADNERGDAVRRYLERITSAAGLPPIRIAASGAVEPAG